MYGRLSSSWKIEGEQFVLDVTVPPNATATVHVPTSAKDADAVEGGAVTEGGKPAVEARGVKFLRMEGDRAVFEVGSGSYSFASE
jgi:alpha-L-rhamnosidase